MEITRTSILTGKRRTLDLPVTQEQLSSYYGPDGPMLQQAFPNLTPGEREFIKTGITDEEWDNAFKTEEDTEE